ncbi:MAG: glycosyltransferase family 8 protein [Bacteroidales bacterium]|jgi:lipopolysaccharide biosynthesis glycosyltransferase|nr:glycosyltransferase family 8 protein [Bacteroidales bacterium]
MADELKKNTSNIIPVVFATDDNYFPYMAVCIQSIMENADAGQTFKIYVLCQTLSDDYKQLLQEQIEPYRNFSIAYIDVTSYFQDHNFRNVRYTVNSLFRLVISYIFTEYKRVIWVDVDMICLTNLADYLLDVDDHSMLKCVKDVGVSAVLRNHAKRMGLKKYQNYFSAGLLVFNTERFRSEITFDALLQLEMQKDLPFADQEILNIVCEDKVQYADMDWNVMVNCRRIYKTPKVIHYVWDKPWKSFYVSRRGQYFWKYAAKTPFYDIIVNQSKKSVKNIMPLIKYGVVSFFARFQPADKMVK